MRAIWSGAVTFGLITIPVKLYSAVSEQRVAFHLLHATDGGRVRNQRVCERDHRPVDWSEIVKGFEVAPDEFVTFTDEELDELAVASGRTIDIDAFVDLEQIDPIYYDATYYLAPDETGGKAYRLLAEALGDQGRAGIAKFAMREKEHLCALRVRDGLLVLQTMHWPAEIRRAGFDRPRAQVKPREVEMAAALVEQLAGDFEPERYRNTYEQRVRAAAKRKRAGEAIVTPAPAAESAPAADLMEMLAASLQQQRTGHAGTRTPAARATKDSSKGGGKSAPRSRAWLLDQPKPKLTRLAQQAGIEGRSKMTKHELVDALAHAKVRS